jgi:hypothetical protein
MFLRQQRRKVYSNTFSHLANHSFSNHFKSFDGLVVVCKRYRDSCFNDRLKFRLTLDAWVFSHPFSHFNACLISLSLVDVGSERASPEARASDTVLDDDVVRIELHDIVRPGALRDRLPVPHQKLSWWLTHKFTILTMCTVVYIFIGAVYYEEVENVCTP